MKVLLLAGSGEARELAQGLAAIPGLEVIASLAGVTRTPLAIGVPTRSGGFGGREAFRAFLKGEAIDLIIDATHPFAARISQRTAEVAIEEGLPALHLLRPEWQPEAGDHWRLLEREEDAAGIIPKGSRVFLATGRQTLPQFANLAGCYLICRQIDPPDGPFPFANGEFRVGRPPFSVKEEIALFGELAVDWLVVKNAGGAASRSKLDAARALGLPVAMIRRPAPPKGEIVPDVAGALKWIRTKM